MTWAFTTGHAGNWHPVTWLSHMLDVELFGVDAGAHHVVSLVLRRRRERKPEVVVTR